MTKALPTNQLPHHSPARRPDIGNWRTLIGSLIEIWADNTFLRTATVETATADGLMMWLRFDGPHLRQIIDRDDHYEVRLPHQPAHPLPAQDAVATTNPKQPGISSA
ncbi:hypothetical protein ACRB8A_00475 [Arthrobacter sp. G.S.26]|uniref:hypothetical protein n=1 Tax=Micrococcaceae TaxID=1268 RepID=UPI00255795F5|nr:hypothetical protein [Pseudarthrobacter sp. MEB009]